MSGKLPVYKYCPFCEKQLPVQAIRCFYCEEDLIEPSDDDPDSLFGETVMLSSVEPEHENLMDIIELEGLGEVCEVIPDPEAEVGEEWKQGKPAAYNRSISWSRRSRGTNWA